MDKKNDWLKVFDNSRNIIVKKNFSLSNITTFGIGGPAKYFIEVKNPDDLLFVWQTILKNKLPRYLLSGGSNIVFSDKGFNGVVVHFVKDGNKGKDISFDKKNKKIFVESNTSLSRLVTLAIDNGFSGFESFSGIPGTVGGAVVGSAGAYGNSVSNFVNKVLIFDGKLIRWVSKKDCKFSYRESIFKKKDWVILGIEFVFDKKTSPVKMLVRSKEILKLRAKKYKKGLRCPGSYFKNILVKDVSKKTLDLIDKKKIIEGKIPTGYLLEEVGAFNMKRGGVFVPDFHGNLIINNGKGKFSDVYELSGELRKRVKKKFGIDLEEEVRVVV